MPQKKMIKYSPLDGKLLKAGRRITRRSKVWLDTAVEYICNEVAKGRSLNDILPDDTTCDLPDFIEFDTALYENAEYEKKFTKAKDIQFKRLRERLISIVNKADTKEDVEEIKAVKEGLKELLAERTENITINIDSVLPDNLWEKAYITHKEQLMK